MKKFFTIVGAALLGLQLSAQKLQPSDGMVNVTSNPTITDLDGNGSVNFDGMWGGDLLWKWSADKDACGVIDMQMTHTADGSGSYKMLGAATDGQGNSLEIYEGTLLFPEIASINVGDEISFSFYAKTDQLPGPSIRVINTFYTGDYSSHWNFSSEQKPLAQEQNGTFSEADVWQEFVYHVTIVDTLIKRFVPGIRFCYSENINLDGDETRENYRPVWIDDAYCSINRLFIKEDATANKTFDGAAIKVDASGNISLADDSAVFPIALANGYDDEYADYKTAGFNSVVVTDATEAQAAVDAGVNYIMDFTQYFSSVTTDDATQAGNITEIENIIDGLNSNDILSSCLFYRLNNKEINRYKIASDVCAAIKAKDDTHPIYMNVNDSPQEVRRFVDADSEEPFIDMAGASVGDGQDAGSGAIMFAIGNYIEGVTVPFNIAELSTVSADVVGSADTSFFASVYAGIANGARGFIFTSDEPDDMSDYVWWNDFPAFKTELDGIMADGIITAPEASWKVSLSDETKNLLEWSARTVDDKSYLILSNMAIDVAVTNDPAFVGGSFPFHMPVNVTVNVEGLGYDIKEITSLLSTSSVTISNITTTSFDIEVPALGYAVLELRSSLTGIKDIESGAFVYPNPTQGNVTVEIANGASEFVTITNIIGAVVKQQQVRGSAVINIEDQANGTYFVKVGNDVTKIILSK